MTTQKWLTYAVCKGLWPNAHFYLYLIANKKYINIYSTRKINGFLTIKFVLTFKLVELTE
jgi:hypothetical protein